MVHRKATVMVPYETKAETHCPVPGSESIVAVSLFRKFAMTVTRTAQTTMMTRSETMGDSTSEWSTAKVIVGRDRPVKGATEVAMLIKAITATEGDREGVVVGTLDTADPPDVVWTTIVTMDPTRGSDRHPY